MLESSNYRSGLMKQGLASGEPFRLQTTYNQSHTSEEHIRERTSQRDEEKTQMHECINARDLQMLKTD